MAGSPAAIDKGVSVLSVADLAAFLYWWSSSAFQHH